MTKTSLRCIGGFAMSLMGAVMLVLEAFVPLGPDKATEAVFVASMPDRPVGVPTRL